MRGFRGALVSGMATATLALTMASPAAAVGVTEFPLASITVRSLTQAGDGTILYAGAHPNGYGLSYHPPSGYLGRVGLGGPLGETAVPQSEPVEIASGSEGDTWFASSESIARLTAAGQWSVASVPPASDPRHITAATGGGIWFAQSNGATGGSVGRISPSGAVSEWFLGTEAAGVGEIVEGPEGDAWFAEPAADQIGRVTPTGQISRYSVPKGTHPYYLTVDREGNVWFDGSGLNEIGRLGPDGTKAMFGLPPTVRAMNLAAGPDGRMWFVEEVRSEEPIGEFEKIDLGRIGPTGRYSEVALPSAAADPVDLIAGSEGNMWFAAFGDPPCEGGGGSCLLYERKSPAIVGWVSGGALSTTLAEARGAVYRNRIEVPVTCSEGNAAQMCRGTVEVKVHGRIVGRDRYVVPVDYTRHWPAKRLGRLPSLLMLTARHRRAVAILHPDRGDPVRRAIALAPAD